MAFVAGGLTYARPVEFLKIDWARTDRIVSCGMWAKREKHLSAYFGVNGLIKSIDKEAEAIYFCHKKAPRRALLGNALFRVNHFFWFHVFLKFFCAEQSKADSRFF